MESIIRLEKIYKSFPGVNALSDVSVAFNSGEVHALIGENGAGKSTLIKTIMGAYIPTTGKIFVENEEIKSYSPSYASKLGIEGVHQELMLIPWLSVWQNIFLNHEIKTKNNLFNKAEMEKQSKALLRSFGLEIDVRKPVKNYSASIWKMIDIARVINLDPKVIVFDEPTAILTDREVKALFNKIKELKSKGIAIIYISHRLNEINEICDKITVLRDGHLIDTITNSNIKEEDIVKMMVGRDISKYYSRNICAAGDEIIQLKNVTLKKGQKNISLTVNKGEIVGLAGLVGSGRTEIAECLIGINKIIEGSIFFKGEKVTPKMPEQMIQKGIYLVPENRKYEGLILSFSVAYNIVLSIFRKWKGLRYNTGHERKIADDMIKALSIRTPDQAQKVGKLSGGNQQKIVIAKALSTKSDFLIFDEPTVGVDVGAKEEIYNLMDTFVQENKGILMISSDLSEIIGMCDRVYIMYEGEIVKELQRKEMNNLVIADYLLGTKRG